jgi:hypothetical protein
MTSGKSGRGGRSRGMITVAIAVVALFLALLSTVFSWRAASTAGHNADDIKALTARLAAVPAAPAPTEPVVQPASGSTEDPAADPTDSPTGSVPTLNAQTQYKIRYTDEPLQVPAGCNQRINVDLDEPRVQVGTNVSELYVACGSPASTIRLGDGVNGSEVQSASVTPIECAERIRTSPLAADVDLPVRRGQVYCITTSRDAAANSAISWKMVVLSVTATAQDGSLTLKATAWDIPA